MTLTFPGHKKDETSFEPERTKSNTENADAFILNVQVVRERPSEVARLEGTLSPSSNPLKVIRLMKHHILGIWDSAFSLFFY